MKVGFVGKLNSKWIKKKSPPQETFYILTSDGKYLVTSNGERVIYKHN